MDSHISIQHNVSNVSAARDLSLVHLPEGTVRVRLAGAWGLDSGLPDVEDVRRELVDPLPRSVTFDVNDLERWDSGVLTFLVQVEDLCASQGIQTDRKSLPEGLRRLIELATAVPETKDARAKTIQPNLLARVGEGALAGAAASTAMIEFLGEVTASVGRMIRGNARFRMSDLGSFLQDCGIQALPIVTLISFLVGLILAFVGAIQLEQFGAQIYVANLVGVAMAREMAGMMAAIIMAGRTGAAFAAQLGTMTVNQEIDALRTMGLPPMDFLVLPRILALCLMMPLLTLYADFVGIIGGGVVATSMLDIPPIVYFQQTASGVTLSDFASGLIKSFFFGAIVAFCGCLRGMQCGSSASAVGEATTSAVVTSIVMIIVTDSLFTVLFNMIGF